MGPELSNGGAVLERTVSFDEAAKLAREFARRAVDELCNIDREFQESGGSLSGEAEPEAYDAENVEHLVRELEERYIQMLSMSELIAP